MRVLMSVFCLAVAAAPAAAQSHGRHTPAHDSAHAVVLNDATHLALHSFLLGRWAAVHGTAHDTLQLRFENDASHQQLMVRHQGGISGFEIRGDTLRWKQEVSGSACVAMTPVSALIKAAKATPQSAQIDGTMTCGKSQSTFTLRKIGT